MSWASRKYLATRYFAAEGTTAAEDSGGPASPPIFVPTTGSPFITGTPKVGETLTLSDGNFSGNPYPSITRQWKRNAVDISGQTGSTYTVVDLDAETTLTATVTLTNSSGTAEQTTAGVEIPAIFSYIGHGLSSATGTAAATIVSVATPLVDANLSFLAMSFDNAATGADGDYAEVTGVTDTQGNSWHKLAEYTNTEGAADAGTTVSLWYCELSPNNLTSTTTTATLSSARTSRNLAQWYFKSTTLSLVAGEVLTAATDASSTYGSLTNAALPLKNRLYIRVMGQESASGGTFTPSVGFTALTGTQTSTMGLRAEFKISSSTGETSNPSNSFASDTASVFLALEADAVGGANYNTSINPITVTSNTNRANLVSQLSAASITSNDTSTEQWSSQIAMYSITSYNREVYPSLLTLTITSFEPTVESSDPYVLATVQTLPTATLTDFPLLVDLSILPGVWWLNCTSSDGTKMQVAQSNGIKIPFDVIDFDTSSNTGWLRCRYPSLPTTGTANLRIYPTHVDRTSIAAGHPLGQYATYAQQTGYFPFNDGSLVDRTAGIIGTSSSLPNAEEGPIAGAMRFTSADSEYLNINAAGPGGDTCIYMAWVQIASTITVGTQFITESISGANAPVRILALDANERFQAYSTGASGSGGDTVQTASTASVGTWYHVAAVRTAGSMRIYVNGVMLDDDAGTAFTMTKEYCTLGALFRTSLGGYSLFFDGSLSDVFLGELPTNYDAWVQEEYNQSNNNATFWGGFDYVTTNPNAEIVPSPAALTITTFEPTVTEVWPPSFTNSLAAYWKFDEASGTVADSVGSTDLTAIGSPTYGVEGKIVDAIHFGSAIALEAASNSVTAIASTSVSYEFYFWVKPTAFTISYPNLINKRTGTGGGNSFEYGCLLTTTTGQTRVYWGVNGGTFASIFGPTITAGSWHFITWGYDASTNKFFITTNNGAKTESGVVTNQVLNKTNSFHIGGSAVTAESYNGAIDEVGFVKNYILTDAERRYLYQSGSGRALTDYYF